MLLFVGFMFYANMTPLFLNQPKEKYLSYNGVSGVSIMYQNKLYTLNFNQQNHLLKYLNELQPSEKIDLNDYIGYEKMIIYRFNEPDLDLQPMGRDAEETLYFNIPDWNTEQYLADTSHGKLKQLIFEVLKK